MLEHNQDHETDPLEMAESIIDAVEETNEDQDDGLTTRERDVEADKESERIRKAKELKKQLRRRELGLLYYRWPAVVLLLSGILAIWTEFLTVTIIDEVGLAAGARALDSFWVELLETGNLYFAFPLISGIILITLAFFAYTKPKVTYLSVIPAMLLASAGMTVYYLVTFAVSVAPDAAGHLLATGAPFTMLLAAILSLLSIALKEKE